MGVQDQGGEPPGADRAGLAGDAEVEVEDVHTGALTSGGAAERGLDRAERDVVEAEGEAGEPGPETAPPAGEEAGARGGAGGAKTLEDLQKQILREDADEVGWTSGSRVHGKTPMQLKRRGANANAGGRDERGKGKRLGRRAVEK